MFFGLEVKSNQSKPLILENTTKLSQAVLEPPKNGKREPVSLVAEYNKKQFILCVLDPNLSWQCPLDLIFEGGSEVKFSLKGTGTVHLTGYEPLDDFDDMNISIPSSEDGNDWEENSDEDEEEEVAMEITPSKQKRLELTNGNGSNGKPTKKAEVKSPRVKRRVSLKPVEKNEDDLDDEESDDEDFEVDESDLDSDLDSQEAEDFELVRKSLEAASSSDEFETEEDDDDDDESFEDEDQDSDEDGCQIEEMMSDDDD